MGDGRQRAGRNGGELGMDGGMIEAVAPPEAIRRAYDLHSRYYSWLVAPLEREPRMRGLEAAGIRPDERVLEVAVGPGLAFVEVLKRVYRSNVVEGVDLSPRMLEATRRRALSAGFRHFRLQKADARALPFPDATFDVLLNSYMLDLIPLDDLPVILAEYRRVLKPGGRLVLVNMSKERGEIRTLWERLYERMPPRVVPYLFGSCRPVLTEQLVRDAGFVRVQREFMGGPFRSEIVMGRVE